MLAAGDKFRPDFPVGLPQDSLDARRQQDVDLDPSRRAFPVARDLAARRIVRRAGRLQVPHRMRLQRLHQCPLTRLGSRLCQSPTQLRAGERTTIFHTKSAAIRGARRVSNDHT